MSRRHAAEKREVLPDAKYGDRVLTKFMNNLMVDGKKSVAEKIVYNALDRVQGRLKREPIEVFHEALDNVKPSVEVRSRRVGGATYQVPVEVRPIRREALGIRWLIDAAKKRNENTMEERLAGELAQLIAKYRDVEMLVQIGEYQKGMDPLADRAIASRDAIGALLRQDTTEISTFDEAVQCLRTTLQQPQAG